MTAGRLVSTIVWICLSTLVVAPVTAWAALALWFRLPAPEWAKAAAAGVFVILALGALLALFTRSRWVALLAFALAFGGVVIWWGSIEPPADGSGARHHFDPMSPVRPSRCLSAPAVLARRP